MATSEDGGILGGIFQRVGSPKVVTDEENEEVRVETDISARQDDVLASPIASTIKDTRKDLQRSNHSTKFDLYDALVNIDGELSGAVNAIAQSATYSDITLPTDDPSDQEKEILRECVQLANRIRGREMAIDVLRNLIKYGNDMNKKIYNGEDGIVAVQSLPVNSMTIVENRDNLNTDATPNDMEDRVRRMMQVHDGLDEGDEELGGNKIREAFERDAYVLNEATDSAKDPDIIEPHNVLHFSIDSRSNWMKDYTGRQTYGVWGQSRLEPLKFTIQTKYNTLMNKVAMDDKLLAREVYYIDTEALFGDIQNRKDRLKAAESYADDLSQMIEELGPDERPMLDNHVEVEVIGPEGKAIDQKPFVEQLNNGIAAALTFPMAGLGRGTTAVKAGEEISSLWAENNIKNLRRSVVQGFRELFADHIKLNHPDLVTNHQEATHLGEMRLDPDVAIPTLEYEPFKQEDMTQKAEQIETMVSTGIMSISEARDEWGLPTDDASMNRLRSELSQFGLDVTPPDGETEGDEDGVDIDDQPYEPDEGG